jgi:hypothetical protein
LRAGVLGLLGQRSRFGALVAAPLYWVAGGRKVDRPSAMITGLGDVQAPPTLPRFRTIQVCPKDLPVLRWQPERAVNEV